MLFFSMVFFFMVLIFFFLLLFHSLHNGVKCLALILQLRCLFLPPMESSILWEMSLLLSIDHPLWTYMAMHAIPSLCLYMLVCTIFENLPWTSPQGYTVYANSAKGTDVSLLTYVDPFDIIWIIFYFSTLAMLEWYSTVKHTSRPHIHFLQSEETSYPSAPSIPT